MKRKERGMRTVVRARSGEGPWGRAGIDSAREQNKLCTKMAIVNDDWDRKKCRGSSVRAPRAFALHANPLTPVAV